MTSEGIFDECDCRCQTLDARTCGRANFLIETHPSMVGSNAEVQLGGSFVHWRAIGLFAPLFGVSCDIEQLEGGPPVEFPQGVSLHVVGGREAEALDALRSALSACAAANIDPVAYARASKKRSRIVERQRHERVVEELLPEESAIIDAVSHLGDRLARLWLSCAGRLVEAGVVERAQARVKNKWGVHGRPSADLSRLASQFESVILAVCRVWIGEAQNMIDLTLLGAATGDEIVFFATGPDGKEATAALARLVASGFGEW
jgi:phosphotransferase system HPr (HPr) family protein